MIFTNLNNHGGNFRNILDDKFANCSAVTIASGYASLDVYNDRAAGATTGFNDIAWFHDISASAADGKDSISISYNLTDSKYTITLGLEGNVQTVSDYRVKSNIADLTGATDIIKALKPRSYNFLDRGTRVGFVAHELEAHVPEAVTGIKDAEEGRFRLRSSK